MDNNKQIFAVLVLITFGGLIVFFQLYPQTLPRAGSKQQTRYPNHRGDLETNEATSETHEVRFSEEWWDGMNSTQLERKARLRRLCRELYRKTPLSPAQIMVQKPSPLRRLAASHNYALIYSVVYKASSSRWSEAFVTELERCEFHPLEEKMYNHTRLRYLNRFKDKKNVTSCLESYRKFLIVRNPLARLVSVYKDKFITNLNWYYKGLARRIINTYRIHDNETTSDNRTSDSVTMKGRPTFVEFISYIVKSNGYRDGNPHWDRVFDNNGVCELEFDVIAKIEDAFDDYAYLTKTLGIWDVTALGKGAKVNINGDKQVRAYFSKVPLDLLHGIYKAYKEDFVLFDYDMPALFL